MKPKFGNPALAPADGADPKPMEELGRILGTFAEQEVEATRGLRRDVRSVRERVDTLTIHAEGLVARLEKAAGR